MDSNKSLRQLITQIVDHRTELPTTGIKNVVELFGYTFVHYTAAEETKP
jgi:hypothetical protein